MSPECVWVKPITFSEEDTEETVREIYAHNTKYDEFCSSSQ